LKDPFARYAAAIVRLRWPVLIGCIVVVALAGGLFAPKANAAVKSAGVTAPNSESVKADSLLETQFHASTHKNAIVVFRYPDATVDDGFYQSQVTSAAAAIRGVKHVTSVETYYDYGDPSLVSPDKHSTLAVVALEGDEGAVEDLVPHVRDAIRFLTIQHWVTGRPAGGYDSHVSSEADLQRSEMFTLPVILLLLLLVFRTVVSALVPLILGVVSIVVATALIYLIALGINTSNFALNTGSMIGLGLAIDYSLIIVSRFREELAKTPDHHAALVATMATSGRSITYSGLTVMLAMAALTLLTLPLMMVRSIAMGVMLVAGISVLVGLTMLPAMLALLGRRIDALRILPRPRTPVQDAGIWYRISQVVMGHPWRWLALCLLVLGTLAFPIHELTMNLFAPPSSYESNLGLDVLKQEFGANQATPVQVVIHTSTAGGAWTPEFLGTVSAVTDAAQGDSRVDKVASLKSLTPNVSESQFEALKPDAFKDAPLASKFINTSGDTAVIYLQLKNDQFSSQSENLVYDLRRTIVPAHNQHGYQVEVGGETATFIDFRDALYSRFPLIVLTVTVIVFAIMLMFFQSIFLPIKAILLNLASILATMGVLVVVFQHGVGHQLLGFDPKGAITVVTPAILYVILFSLSTDYEVFMLSRVREYYTETGDNQLAVSRGLQRTAGVITAAAVILIGTFGSFTTGAQLTIKEIGLGLAVGVLLDASLVRVIMVPATMRLMGRWNWWAPGWLTRILPKLSEGPAPEPASVRVPAPAADGAPRLAAQTVVLATPATVGRLVPVEEAPGRGVRLPARGGIGVGRDRVNELSLQVTGVSRFHARIQPGPRGYEVTDLRSLNGVWVNGERLPPEVACVLRPGDLIAFGNSAQTRFRFEEEPAGVATPVP